MLRTIFLLLPVFSVSLYIIGLMGMRQKPVNPLFEKATVPPKQEKKPGTSVNLPDNLPEKTLEELGVKKVYLNSDLNIMEFAKSMGSNRTYISTQLIIILTGIYVAL